MTGEVRRFAVVGGGIAGLAAAHRLCELCSGSRHAPAVVVLEASERFGGLIRTERAGEALVEGGADSFLAAKPGGVELCERLGLGGELVRIDSGAAGTRILVGGRLHELPAGFLMIAPTRFGPLLRSPLFSLRAKLRMMLERFVPRAREAADESLASFVVRRFGREALERIAEPVLASVFMADAEKLSVSAALPRFVEMERAFGSVTRGVRRRRGSAADRPQGAGGFAYLRSGTSRVVERLLEQLPPGAARARAGLRALEGAEGGRWRLRVDGGAEVLADAVVLACPTYASAPAIAALDADLSREIGRQSYASCATVSLSYKEGEIGRALEGFGFFVPRSEGLALLAASFTSLKFPGRWRSGEVLVRCFLGGALHPALADLPESELGRLACEELGAVLAIRAEPRFMRVIRFPRSMPQYEVGFPERLRAIRERLAAHPGLFLAGSGMGAVGLPDCIRSGEEAAHAAFTFAANRVGAADRAPAGAARSCR
jgi:oxygen-dependent protoporphyrinogen oxidase